MNIRIMPTSLHGSVVVPSSKSIGHRELICAALAQGESVVENISVSQDIEATCRLLQAFGASIEEIPSAYEGRTAYRVKGGLTKQGGTLTVDCGESGSTLRFLIPVGLYSGNTVVYTGRGQLVKRPLEPYYRIFDEHGVSYKPTEGGLPLTVEGCLQPGRYALAGDVSSQFFTGLLVMLPLLDGDSVLESTTPLESLSYVTMTLDCMARHGVDVQWMEAACFIFLEISSIWPGPTPSKAIIRRRRFGLQPGRWDTLWNAWACAARHRKATK